MIVKRLVCIEDLGNVQVLFTDKTGTLTEGHISFTQPLDCHGNPDDHVRALGLVCSDKTGNELDRALWAAEEPSIGERAAGRRSTASRSTTTGSSPRSSPIHRRVGC